MKSSTNRLVYSDQLGRICPDCCQPKQNCRCKKTSTGPKSDGIVRIQRETKGRKGKGVTLVSGIPLAESELKMLAKALKQKCGTGGTVKNGIIEIQGDHRDLLMGLLQEKGWTVKKAGG
ncbi:MAG: translation initiation factor Sui1 [Deltaproteobacteria bacterium]|jgi:translation initiation factor 1|nr:translation initiation factor Sui1 [Deltaproteobacteria bacterium]MCW8892327.1 translation initiation factor Sui1 [Deltaproteobacteria bacterium]MCW9049516.1 translation initiation factor Sui1 [Deltaproteobacteria bacterium]